MGQRSTKSSSDRRRALRRPAPLSIRIVMPAGELHGRIDNLSATGVLFLSEDALRVTVEIEEDGVAVRRPGRLVRAQRMQGDSIGWAVEFDPR